MIGNSIYKASLILKICPGCLLENIPCILDRNWIIANTELKVTDHLFKLFFQS